MANSPSLRIAVGLLIGQGLIYSTLPIITRQFSPAEMGAAGTFLSIASIVGVVATLRLETMIPASTPDEEPWLLKCSVLSTIIIGLSSGVVAVGLGMRPELSLLLALTVASLGGTAVVLQLAARHQQFRGVPFGKAFQGVSQVISHVGAGAAGFTRTGLQFGYSIGYVISMSIQYLAIKPSLLPKTGLTALTDERKKTLRSQALWLTIAALLNAITVWVYPILTQIFYTSEETGQLTVAMRLVTIPASIVVASVAPIVTGAVAHSVRNGKSPRALIFRYLKFLTPLAAFTLLVSQFIPDSWMTGALGSDWSAAGSYLRALGPSTALQIAVGPLSLLLIVQGRTRTQFVWDATRTLTLVATVILLALSGATSAQSILGGSLVVAAFYAVYVALVLQNGRGRTIEPR